MTQTDPFTHYPSRKHDLEGSHPVTKMISHYHAQKESCVEPTHGSDALTEDTRMTQEVAKQ